MIPAFAMAIFIIIALWSTVRETLKKDISKWADSQWFGMGVFIGFFGGMFDWLYWETVWFLVFKEATFAESMVYIGPIVNIFFRSLVIVVSGYCHARALAIRNGIGVQRVNDLLKVSSFVALFMTFFFIFF